MTAGVGATQPSSSFRINPQGEITNIEKEVKKTIDLTKEGLNQFKSENPDLLLDKSIVLIGKTGTGKSTMVNLIAGAILQSKFNENDFSYTIEAPEPKEGIIISHKVESETSVPHKCVIGDVAYWDTPGFFDTRGFPQEVANAICMKNIFDISSYSKIMVLVDEATFRDNRAIYFMDFIRQLNQFLGKNPELYKSLSLVISQASEKFTKEDVFTTISNIINDLALEEHEEKLLLALQKNLLTIFRQPKPTDMEITTTEIRKEIQTNLDKIPYTKDMKVHISLSSDAKKIALSAYNNLNVKIQEKLKNFLDGFIKSINDFVVPCLTLTDIDPDQLENIKTRLTNIKKELGEITVSLENVGEMLSTCTQTVSKCSEISKECGSQISMETVSQALENVSLIHFLEDFIDPTSRLPLDIVAGVKNEVIKAQNLIEIALTKMEAARQKERADKEAARAEKQTKRAEKNIKKVEELKKRTQEAEECKRQYELQLKEIQKQMSLMMVTLFLAFL